jgi:uncharacterized protein YodC (DUF2158 family)
MSRRLIGRSSKMDDIRLGDSVRARASGLVMVVEEVFTPLFKYRFRCMWIDEEGSIRHEVFCREDLETLTLSNAQ